MPWPLLCCCEQNRARRPHRAQKQTKSRKKDERGTDTTEQGEFTMNEVCLLMVPNSLEELWILTAQHGQN